MLKAFDSVKPTAETIEKMAKLRQAYSDLATLIFAEVPTSRERSVAMTELEGSAMWAIKALTHNQVEPPVGTKGDPAGAYDPGDHLP